jgi:hypothetical protein
MSIIVEDGSGLNNSNSFTSVAFADAYHTTMGAVNVAWLAANNTDKENALQAATMYMEIMYKTRWVDRRLNQLQALSWPRAFVRDADGFAVGANSVPVEVQRACAEWALRVIQGDNILPDVVAGASGIASESVTVGPITTSKTYIGGKTTRNYYPRIEMIIKMYLNPLGQIWRA